MNRHTKYRELNDEESECAVKAFHDALPGVYGLPEAIDEMLKKLHDAKIIKRI